MMAEFFSQVSGQVRSDAHQVPDSPIDFEHGAEGWRGSHYIWIWSARNASLDHVEEVILGLHPASTPGASGDGDPVLELWLKARAWLKGDRSVLAEKPIYERVLTPNRKGVESLSVYMTEAADTVESLASRLQDIKQFQDKQRGELSIQ